MDARNAKDDSDDSYLQYLSLDEDIAIAMNTPFSTLPGSSTAGNMNKQDGFSLQEIGHLLSKKGAIVCCNFSSDGELLATAGHGEKVYIWSVKEFDCIKHGEGHFGLITDIQFRPSSSFFATSSFDRTMQIWDADRPRRPVFPLVGHTGKVTSIDFHPVNSDILCSCDNTDQIHMWHVNSSSCAHVFKGGSRQVRFQPQSGDLLAAASENAIKLFDVQTNTLLCCLEFVQFAGIQVGSTWHPSAKTVHGYGQLHRMENPYMYWIVREIGLEQAYFILVILSSWLLGLTRRFNCGIQL